MGAALGFVTFFAAYLLPYVVSGNESKFSLTFDQSIYGSTLSILEKFSTQGVTAASGLLLAGAIMIVVGGAYGVRPRIGASFGIAGMVVETVGKFLSATGASFSIDSFGAGYWILWITALGTMAAAIWVWRDERGTGAKATKGWSR
jgi:hypothetical protein